MISRSSTWRALAAGLLLAGCGSESGRHGGAPLAVTGMAEAGAPAFERVVLVTIDTLRADHLETYGYYRETSPFLDELARSSVVFERAMSASSHTAPSHASLFTGLPPGLHGLLTNGNRLDDGVVTLAKALGDADFESAAFTSVEFLEGVANGFDSVRARTAMARGLGSAAISWLRRDRTQDRFFLWLHFYEPHRWKTPERLPVEHLQALRATDPLPPEERYAEIARRHGLALPFAAVEWREGDAGDEDLHTDSLEEVLGYIDSYDAQIRYADAELARVHAALEGLELAGETLWIVTADHGEGLGSHAYAGHGWQIYQEQLHVPLIVHASHGSLPPRRVEELVSLTDVLPTVVDLFGGRLEGFLAPHVGRSLAPLLRGAGEPVDALVFAQRRPLRKTGGDGVFALQSTRHKLILRTTGDDEFYDLVRDPLERENRIGEASPELGALRSALEARLSAFTDGLVAGEGTEKWQSELRDLGYAE